MLGMLSGISPYLNRPKGSVQQPDKSTFIKNEFFMKYYSWTRNIYILVEQSDKSLYYFQRYLKKNYFPPIKVNEIKNFVLLLLNNW